MTTEGSSDELPEVEGQVGLERLVGYLVWTSIGMDLVGDDQGEAER